MFNSDSRDSESDMIVVNVKENEVYTDPGWCERSVILILNQGTSFYFTAQGCFIPHISSWTTCSVTDRDMHCLQRTGVVDSGLQWTFQIGNRMGEEKTTDIQYCGIMVVAELLLFVFPAGDSFFFSFSSRSCVQNKAPSYQFQFLSEWVYLCERTRPWVFSNLSPLEDISFALFCLTFIQKWKHLFSSKATNFWWHCVETGLHQTCNMITPQVAIPFSHFIHSDLSDTLIYCNIVQMWQWYVFCFFLQCSSASLHLLVSQLQGSQSEVSREQVGTTLALETECSVSGVMWPQRAGRPETVRQRNTDSSLLPALSSKASRLQPTCSPPLTLLSPLFVLLRPYQ